MARQIIVRTRTDMNNYFQFNVIFWLSVPVAKQPALSLINKNATSAVLDCSQQELDAIHAGQILEQERTFSYSINTAIPDVGTDLVTKYQAEQNTLNATLAYQYYGTFYDGSGWNIQGG